MSNPLKLSPALSSSILAAILLFSLSKCGTGDPGLQEASLNGKGGTETTELSIETQAATQLAKVIDTRATYLLGVFQQKEVAIDAAIEHQSTIAAQIVQLQSSKGVFQGDAEGFARLTNLTSEHAATTLVIHWLEEPQSANQVVSIPLNEPYHVEGEVESGW